MPPTHTSASAIPANTSSSPIRKTSPSPSPGRKRRRVEEHDERDSRSIKAATMSTHTMQIPTTRTHTHTRPRLMSLAEMSFKTVQTHLTTSTDRSEIHEIQSYLQDPETQLTPHYLSPLLETCTTSLSRLDKIDRAKKAAHDARVQASLNRPSAVVLGSSELHGRRTFVGPSRERKLPSQGGRRILQRAKSAGAKSRW